MSADPLPRRRWRRIAAYGFGAVVAVILVIVAGLILIPFGQRVDSSWRPSVAAPRYVKEHPLVCFDDGHYNAHKSNGRYRPVARLVEADGYPTRAIPDRFTPAVLAPCRILVIANAAGGDRLRLGPINLPIHFGGKREDPAFRADEIGLVKNWVEKGGALLLVADHVPFGQASSALASAFGVTMHGGMADTPRSSIANAGRGRTIFSTSNGLLRPHPITTGIGRVMTFTGQSLTGAGEPLLRLPDDAVEFMPPGPVLKPVPAGGHSQAVALETGRGRVVVLGEAGMLSAQIDARGEKMGMNVAGNDNQAFALNIFHWLSRADGPDRPSS